MIDFKQLEEVVADQLANFLKKEEGIVREVDLLKVLKTNQITIISGIRRSGKSTLLKQISKKLDNFYYLNFDDERLIDFAVKDFNNLLIVWQKQQISKNILLDEIQNIPSWERFIRRVHDEGYKIFITGSNAKLLSGELSTHLTGRYIKIELYPFSFSEVILFNKISLTNKTSVNKAKILKTFDDYLQTGGFPEYLKYRDVEFVKRTYEDIVYKDIIVRFGIKEITAFRQLANFLFTNFTKAVSYNSLKNTLGFKSPVSVKDYIGFLQESYLLFELFQYDFSLKKQLVNNKKIYVIDNGMRNNIAFAFSEDRGKLLENLIFIELKRRGLDVYCWQEKNECDFIILKTNKIIEAIQVCSVVNNLNEKRELDGLIEAMEKFKLKEGIILTENQDEIRKIAGKTIKLISAWRWLLE